MVGFLSGAQARFARLRSSIGNFELVTPVEDFTALRSARLTELPYQLSRTIQKAPD